MSMRRKKPGLVISWHKSISILAPWRKGKGDRDAVLDTEVVLTKMKLFSNFHEKLLTSGDSVSTISTVSEQDLTHLTKAPGVNSHLDDKSGPPQMETSTDYLPAVFPDSQLPRLYKFESEDSGVDLPSGANSPSTPTGSEQSFVVHSRESSCDSGNLNSDSALLPDKPVTFAQTPEIKQANYSRDKCSTTGLNSQANGLHSGEPCSSAVEVEVNIDKDVDRDQCRALGSSPEGDEKTSEQLEHNRTVAGKTCSEDLRPGMQPLTRSRNDTMSSDFEPEPLRRSGTDDSLEEYMDECCRLSEAQQASASPLLSGLGYLEHICQLIEKIGQLQETNLRLQRQICGLQKESRMTKTKEDFFHQHCSCGAASLILLPIEKRHSRSEFLSPSGTLSDLSTIPEVTQQPLIPVTRDGRGEGLTSVPLWRGLNRRSYTEGEARFLRDGTDAPSSPHRRLSENYTWSRVKDMVRKTKFGSQSQSRLGLSSASLKMSCPQLYRPDLGPVKPAGRNRNSMIVLGHQSKLDFPWLH